MSELGELYREGKVKKVYFVEGAQEFEFEFTDNISVFDKVIPSTIPRKGESLCRTSAYWFEQAEKAGIKTHYISSPAPDRMRVKRVEVIEDLTKLSLESTNHLIPLEVIARYYLAGSMHDRIKRGDRDAEELGFDPGHEVVYGERLPKPLVEFTTKLEEVDRPLTEEEAIELARITHEELQALKDAVLTIDGIIEKEASARGLIHVDGKKEFAFDENRNLMLIDTFGTPDEDRFWDADKYAEGEFVDQSKEMVRQFYRSTGYHDELQEARRNKEPEPPIPALSDDMVAQVSKLYAEAFERLTGGQF